MSMAMKDLSNVRYITYPQMYTEQSNFVTYAMFKYRFK